MSIILRINAKFSGYWLYMNTNIYGAFQIGIFVPLTKLCLACVKQKSTKVCKQNLFIAKYTLSDLVGQRPSLLIINFEQVMKAFLV